MGLLCPCRNCREALHRELDKLWPPSVRRRASGQKEESRALEIPGKTTAWFPKKLLHVSLGNAVYLFRFLWSVFFLPLFFCCSTISSLRSTIAEHSRNYLEVSYKDVPSFHDRTITYLSLDSRVHRLALLHFGCGCMVQSYRFSGMAWQSSAIPMEKVGICTGAANQSNRCRRTQTQAA